MSIWNGHRFNSSAPDRQSDSRAPPPPSPHRRRTWLPFLGLGAALLLVRALGAQGTSSRSLTYSAFLSQVQSNHVRSAVINPAGAVSGTLTNGTGYTSQIPAALPDPQLPGLLRAHHVVITGVGTQTSIGAVIVSLLPLLFFVALFVWIGRRGLRQAKGGIMGIGGSKAKLYDEERPSVGFSDVAGYEAAKREVSEVVDFLKHPEKYAGAGATGPRGVLMVGPPGTGKTLLARAVAGEAEVPFFALTGSSFVEMFVGVGASRARALFADARKRAPSIIFIDEVDAIGQRRGGSVFSNDEREQTLNQLLAEMDGFDPTAGVVVMAATNRPEILDPALLRPGRFDRQVEIPLPNQLERTAILTTHARSRHLAADVDLKAVSRGTPGFSGADLANLINEAAIVAVRDNRDVIVANDLEEARDRILLGPRDSSNALLPGEQRAVAIHEAGHALVALCSEHADPVAKVTILPAGSDPSESPSSCRRTNGICIQRATSTTLLLSAWEAAPPSFSCWAKHRPARPATSQGRPSWRRGWSGTGVSRLAWGLLASDREDRPISVTSQPKGRTYAEGTQLVIDEEVSRILSEAGGEGAHDPLRTSCIPRRRHRPPAREGDDQRGRIDGRGAPVC